MLAIIQLNVNNIILFGRSIGQPERVKPGELIATISTQATHLALVNVMVYYVHVSVTWLIRAVLIALCYS